LAVKSSDGFRLVTRVQLAQILQKDARTIARWLEDGLPVAVKGRGGRPSKYDLADCVPWVIERELQIRSADTGGTESPLSPQAERAKLDHARRQELELKLRVRNGELVEVESIQAEYADIAVAVKSRLRAIPDAVADQIAGRPAAAIKALLSSKIDDALHELARGIAIVDTDEHEDVDESAPMEIRP